MHNRRKDRAHDSIKISISQKHPSTKWIPTKSTNFTRIPPSSIRISITKCLKNCIMTNMNSSNSYKKKGWWRSRDSIDLSTPSTDGTMFQIILDHMINNRSSSCALIMEIIRIVIWEKIVVISFIMFSHQRGGSCFLREIRSQRLGERRQSYRKMKNSNHGINE